MEASPATLQHGGDVLFSRSCSAVSYVLISGFVVYKVIDMVSGFHLAEEQEFNGADLSVHHINAYPEENVR